MLPVLLVESWKRSEQGPPPPPPRPSQTKSHPRPRMVMLVSSHINQIWGSCGEGSIYIYMHISSLLHISLSLSMLWQFKLSSLTANQEHQGRGQVVMVRQQGELGRAYPVPEAQNIQDQPPASFLHLDLELLVHVRPGLD